MKLKEKCNNILLFYSSFLGGAFCWEHGVGRKSYLKSAFRMAFSIQEPVGLDSSFIHE